jgi:hypothetical protein
LATHKENGICSNDLGRIDFKENLQIRMEKKEENLKLRNVYVAGYCELNEKHKTGMVGHVFKMEGTLIPKLIINTKLQGRAGVKKPKLIWSNDVWADITPGTRRSWRLKAQAEKDER